MMTFLIQSKLSLRRAYRNWRRGSRKVLHADAPDPDPATQLSTKRRHPSQLPNEPSDNAPTYIPILLFFVALLPRIYRLPHPPSVVFDEVHFLRFVKGYYEGKYFFDIHPPLGKLILYLVTFLFCGRPTLAFEYNGEEFGEQRYVPLRLTSALFGASISPLSYLICRELGLSLPASLLPAVIQSIEHLAIIESRLVLMDAQLMAFIGLSLLLALRMWGAPRGRRWRLVIGTALVASAALSVKWTALVTPALIAIVSLTAYPFASAPLLPSEIAVAGVTGLSLYVATFWLHFRFLPNSGLGDAFMSKNFQKTLIGGKYYEEGYRGPGFVRNFLYLNYEMFLANRGIKARHHWESHWWQWVINQRGLLYYNENNEGLHAREKVYLIVNPAVTILTLISLVVFIRIVLDYAWKSLRDRKKWDLSRRMRGFLARGGFLLAGYVFNLLPYVGTSKPFNPNRYQRLLTAVS